MRNKINADNIYKPRLHRHTLHLQVKEFHECCELPCGCNRGGEIINVALGVSPPLP